MGESKTGWTVVMEFGNETGKSIKYIGFQTKEKAQQDLEYLKKDWDISEDKPLYRFRPTKLYLKRLTYQAWLQYV
jgi:hypothetical protein